MTVTVSLPASVAVATNGAQGLPGSPGTPGSNGTNGTNGNNGSNGAAGHTPQLYGGAAAPSTLHNDGDLYLRTNGDLYQQVASSWGSPIGNIQGPQGLPGSGGGSTITTAEARITAENIAMPNTGGWAVVTTSAGTGSVPLQCSIPAAVGDRIQVSAVFMRTGSGVYLDLAILDSAGAISSYAGSGTGSPLQEGAPAYYPQSSVFPGATSPQQFTVQAGQLNAGVVTIALVYKGAGAGSTTLYASATYPWYMLLTNIHQ